MRESVRVETDTDTRAACQKGMRFAIYTAGAIFIGLNSA